MIQELNKIHFRNLLSNLIELNKSKINIIENEVFGSMNKIEELLNLELSKLEK